jgi:hypothetical protein
MRYREVGLLAEGGMALIARAETDDGGVVVVKRVRPPFCFDPSFLRLFADEGAVHAVLEHENIVRLLDRGEDDAGPYLVFEHVDGTDLAHVLEAQPNTPLEVECVLAVALPLFRALAAAHEVCGDDGKCLAVVHRDVSPGNVLISDDGAVKLADFGVASFSLKTELTVAGEMKGKFAYMAPEQTRGERVDPRADLFAAGVVLWECLAGKRLFDGPTDADVVAAVRTQAAPRLDTLEHGARLPPELVALVAQLLEKAPEARPPHARDVVKRLDAIALSLGLDEGLARHAARLARRAPRRALQVRDVDARRRTQRVMGADAPGTGAVVVRRSSRSMLGPAAAAAAVVVVVAAIAVAQGRDDVTPLPDTPGPVAMTKPVDAPAVIDKPVVVDKPVVIDQPAVPAVIDKPVVADKPVVDKPVRVGALVKPRDKGGAIAGERPAGFGKLWISTEPWASVTVDGALVDKETPLLGFTLPAGPHVVVLENPVYGLKRTLRLDIPADGEVKKFVDLNTP